MKIGLLTRNSDAWCSAQLQEALLKRGVESFSFSFPSIVARIGGPPIVTVEGVNVADELSGIIVRPIGRGSLDEIIFRLDVLHTLERNGLLVVNPPSAIEKSVDKYYTLKLLEEEGIPTPPTIVTENAELAVEAFRELGGDVVMKPLFGSRGMGICRVSDEDVASRIFRSLHFTHNVLYVQKFIPHGTADIRTFVVGDRVVAAMQRRAEGWKTNVSLGAKPVSYKPPSEVEEMTVRAATKICCKVAGVDVLEGKDGYMVNEINSQPGFRGLQSVTKIKVAERIVDYVLQLARR